MMWLIVGLLIGAIAVYLAQSRQLNLGPLDWVLLVAAVIFILLALANFTGSLEEREPLAATVLLASFGIPGLILLAVIGVRVWRKRSLASPLAAGKS